MADCKREWQRLLALLAALLRGFAPERDSVGFWARNIAAAIVFTERGADGSSGGAADRLRTPPLLLPYILPALFSPPPAAGSAEYVPACARARPRYGRALGAVALQAHSCTRP
jgi:hypothetical protein